MKNLVLNNGKNIPVIGLGTWKSNSAEIYSAIRWAIKLGYKHFDCASIYNNEETIGLAISDCMIEEGLKREDVFITSKLWNNAHHPEDVLPSLKNTLARLKLDYLDLYLMHWPVAQKKESYMPFEEDDMISLDKVPLSDTWQAMEEAYQQGLVKAIGVSNFGVNRLTELMMTCQVYPMVNQVECHPYFAQEELLNFCNKNDIIMTAYSPLGSGSDILFIDETLSRIAKKHEVSVAEVVLAWNIARDVVVIPKATEEFHLRNNIASLNLYLDDNDMEQINNLGKEQRILTGDIFKLGAYKNTDIFA